MNDIIASGSIAFDGSGVPYMRSGYGILAPIRVSGQSAGAIVLAADQTEGGWSESECSLTICVNTYTLTPLNGVPDAKGEFYLDGSEWKVRVSSYRNAESAYGGIALADEPFSFVISRHVGSLGSDMPSALVVKHFRHGVQDTRGAPRVAGFLCDALREEGYEVTDILADVAHNAIGKSWDVVFWQGKTCNADMFASLAAERTYLYRHGDESLRDCAPDALRFRPRTWLLLPSEWAANHVTWDVKKAILWPCLQKPASIAPTRGNRVLFTQAGEPGKGTELAWRVAKELPDVSFVFRDVAENASRVSTHNVTSETATRDPEKLWHDVGCVLIASATETFSLIAYEALCRGIPVVATPNLAPMFAEWTGAIRMPVHLSKLGDCIRQALYGGSPTHSRHKRDGALVAHETAREQLRSLLVRNDE